MPPVQPRSTASRDSFWKRATRPVIVAHRYGNDPNLIIAAELAGADLLEADVWLHRGRLEIRHSKTAGPLPIVWDRWWAARRPSRPFQAIDLLHAAAPDTPIMFDLKGRNPRLPERLIALLERERGDRPVLVCTPNWRMLEPFTDAPGIEIVHSIGSRKRLEAAWPLLHDQWREAISIHMNLLDHGIVQRLKSLVDAVITWPVNTEDQMRRVLEFGVDGFTSDSLPLMAKAAASKREDARVTAR